MIAAPRCAVLFDNGFVQGVDNIRVVCPAVRHGFAQEDDDGPCARLIVLLMTLVHVYTDYNIAGEKTKLLMHSLYHTVL
jgi:hypothetical protein